MKGDHPDPFMYFISTGQFEVSVTTNFCEAALVKSEQQPKKTTLYAGDHFGEIGLIYNSKRTATV